LFPEKTKNSTIKIFPKKKRRRSNDNPAIKKKKAIKLFPSLPLSCLFPETKKKPSNQNISLSPSFLFVSRENKKQILEDKAKITQQSNFFPIFSSFSQQTNTPYR
jgi:hypothetical protein